MKFTSHEREYCIDQFGVIVQTDHRPYRYDAAYSAIYDSPEYMRQSELLQAMRYGFVLAAHGRPPQSILDVGYGNGAFINFVKAQVPYVYGYDVTGVPLDGAYRMPGIIKADIITMWDVLEHFPSVDFLRDLPCETLVVSLPYCHVITEGAAWFSSVYPHRKPDEHIRHFNRFSLANMMQHYGWQAIAESNHEDVVRKSKHGLQNILSMAFKRKHNG